MALLVSHSASRGPSRCCRTATRTLCLDPTIWYRRAWNRIPVAPRTHFSTPAPARLWRPQCRRWRLRRT